MQCKNGGWGSFDKDNTKMIFQYIPFADHNAMLDPPTVDITGRILEMLATYGYTRSDKRVEKAIKFIFSEQEPDGSWFGRWGVNYIYGTFLVLRGLDAIGIDHHEPQIQQAAEWIRMVQNPDGGWGETCGSYDDPEHARRGPEHAFANRMGAAWPAGRGRRPLRLHRQGRALAADAPAARRQLGRVAWAQELHARHCTLEQASRRVFYLAYDMYRQYFPLLALTGYKRAMERAANSGAWRITQRWLFRSPRCGRLPPMC